MPFKPGEENILGTAYVAACYMTVYIAWNGVQTIAGPVFGRAGSAAMAVTYTSAAVSGLFIAAPAVHLLGNKRAMQFCALPFFVFCLLCLVPSFYTLIPISVFIGMSHSTIWTAQGAYVDAFCTPTTSGLHSGVFLFIFQGSQLFGNIITSAVGSGDNVVLFVGFAVIVAVGGMMMVPLPSVDTAHGLTHDQIIARIKSCQEPMMVRHFAMNSKAAQYSIPLYMLSGLTCALYFGFFPTIIVFPSMPGMVGYCAAVFGAVDMVASAIVGKVVDKFPSSTASSATCGIAMIGMNAWLACVAMALYNYPSGGIPPGVLFTLSGFMGLVDALTNVIILRQFSRVFHGHTDVAVGLYRFCQFTTAGICFFVFLEIPPSAVFILSGLFALFTMVMFLYSTKHDADSVRYDDDELNVHP